MKHWRSGTVVVGVMALMTLGIFAWCRSLDPDEGKAKREVERVIPGHMGIVSASTGHCGVEIISQCTIFYTLDGDTRDYIEDGRVIRSNLLESGWTETSYTENANIVAGLYEKDSMSLELAIRSAAAQARCVSGCPNHILVWLD